MATALSVASSSSNVHRQLRRGFSRCRALPSSSYFIPPPPFRPPSQLRRPTFILLANPRTTRCFAVAPGPPSPPGPDPPPPGNTTQLAGLVRAVSRIQDRVKIFFAVLFWMSLFFWVSASDRRGKGKRKKSSRFK